MSDTARSAAAKLGWQTRRANATAAVEANSDPDCVLAPQRDVTVPTRSLTRERSVDVPSREIAATRNVTRILQYAPDLSLLYPFQIEAVTWLRTRDRAVLAFQQRLGKSGCALRALPQGGRTIIVCPMSLRLQWRDAIAGAPLVPGETPTKSMVWRPDLRVRIATSGDSLIPEPGEAVITNYEAMPDPVGKSALIDANLRDVYFIIDEAHALAHTSSLRSQRCRALGRQVRAVWALTGTPMPGSPMDLWGLLDACGLARKAFGSFKAFLRIFGGKRRHRHFGDEYEFTVTELDQIQVGLAKVMRRLKRSDVYPEMPPKNYTTIPVEITASSTIEHAEREWQLCGATKLPPFELLSAAMAELASAKIEAMLKEVKAAEDAGLPLLVFAGHRAPIDALERREGWANITGDTAVADRHEIVRRFQAGDLRGIGITIKAGGTGLTLPRAADELFVSLDWTPSLNEQAEDRAISIQDKHKVLNVTRLVADHPLDRRLFEILGAKESLIAGVVG